MVDDMAVNRCQMCGKDNPEDLEVCQHCGARLKPLLASPPEAPQKDTQADSPSATPEDTVSWLRSLGEDDQAQPLSDSGELPDWLDDAPAPAFALFDEPEPAPAEDAPPPPADDLPDWLTRPAAEPPPSEKQGDFDDLPHWLSAPAAQPSSQETPADDFSEWFSSLDASDTGPPEILSDFPSWLDEEAPKTKDQDKTDDWLAALEDQPEEAALGLDWEALDQVGEEKLGAGFGTIGGLTLDAEDSFAGEIQKGDLPDWLDSLYEPDLDDSRTAAQASTPARPPEAVPPPAKESWGDLSSRAQDFQPIEGASLASEHTEGELERAGPLSGLRGLLPAEVEITQVTRAPAYVSGLQVSSGQQKNAKLLFSLVETESRLPALSEASAISSQRLFRVLVGAVLLLAVLFPLLSGTQMIPLPTALPPEIQSVQYLVNGVGPETPVLVVFDYQPGFSGELEAAAVAVFDHLMERRVPLVLVSTSPLGTGLGERYIATTMRQFPYQHQYVYGENYVNLGYLAGGSAGLLNFALSPRQATIVAYDSRPVWELLDRQAGNPWFSPVAQSIVSLADFAMTLVITDDADTARGWIEQVEPALREDSLVMIVSAQIEPMVRPYLQTADVQVAADSQLQGNMAGLKGSAAYERSQGQFGLARLYWDAYGVGMLVAMVLILVGGGYNYISTAGGARAAARPDRAKR